MLAEPLQLFVQDFERFLGDVVRFYVVDRNLKMVQTGPVQLLDTLRRQQVTVRDQSGNDSVGPDAADDVIKLRMQQGFTTADGNERSAQGCEFIHAAVHFFQRNGIRKIVVFIAVGAGEIAAPHGDYVDLNGMVGGKQTLRDHFEFAKSTVRGPQPAPDPEFQVCHV